jgi:hypothetical protein
MANRAAIIGRFFTTAAQAGVRLARIARPALASLPALAARGLNRILPRADIILPLALVITSIDWNRISDLDYILYYGELVLNVLYDNDNDGLYYEDYDTGVSTYYNEYVHGVNQMIEDVLDDYGFGSASSASAKNRSMRHKNYAKIAKEFPQSPGVTDEQYHQYLVLKNYHMYVKPKLMKQAQSKKVKPMPIVSKGSGRMCPKCGMPKGETLRGGAGRLKELERAYLGLVGRPDIIGNPSKRQRIMAIWDDAGSRLMGKRAHSKIGKLFGFKRSEDTYEEKNRIFEDAMNEMFGIAGVRRPTYGNPSDWGDLRPIMK